MFIRHFLVALGCLSFALSVAAADESTVSSAADAHRPRRWSLQFQVGDNFRVSGFGGAGLAVTRNLDADDAWRFGLGWNGNFAHQESFSQQLQADTVAYQIDGPTRDEDRFSVTADLLWLHRAHPGRRVGIECGIGPRFTIDYRKSTDLNGTGTQSHEGKETGTFVGLAGKLGAEVFVARSVSVHAHYGGSFGYSQRTSTDVFVDTGYARGEKDRRRTRAVMLGQDGVTLGISLYL